MNIDNCLKIGRPETCDVRGGWSIGPVFRETWASRKVYQQFMQIEDIGSAYKIRLNNVCP